MDPKALTYVKLTTTSHVASQHPAGAQYDMMLHTVILGLATVIVISWRIANCTASSPAVSVSAVSVHHDHPAIVSVSGLVSSWKLYVFSGKSSGGRDSSAVVRKQLVPKILKDSLASMLATAVVKIALQPFDTVKTVQQMNSFQSGILATASQIVHRRGMHGLWAGAGVTVFGSMPSVAVYFSTFNSCKGRLAAILPAHYRPFAIALAAMIANSLACVLRVPYEVLKHRMQMERHANLGAAIAFSLREEGMFGMFNGGKLAIQVLRDVPYAMITAVCYECLQGMMNNRIDRLNKRESLDLAPSQTAVGPAVIAHKRRTVQDALCGSIAGAVSITLTTPLDVVKTRLMSGGDQYGYSTVTDAVTRMLREEGWGALTLGISSRLLHKVPANGLFYLCYEVFRTLLGVGEHYR